MNMNNLRTQLLVSHLLLILLMLAVMGVASINFFRLGRSIDRILQDNYKSVIAAQDMKEALERMDSSATFFLAGQVAKARKQYQTHWPRFQSAYHIEANNITEHGEQAIADDIGWKSTAFRLAVEKLLYDDPPMTTHQARTYYFERLEPAFLALKQRAQDVLNLNQQAILRADAKARGEARRATWISLGMAAGAFLLAFWFASRMIRYALVPLGKLAYQAEEIGAGRMNQRIDIRRADEIGALAESFNRMAERLQEAWFIEEQRLHRAQQMSDAALANLFDPVIVTDAKGFIVYMNQAGEGIFGESSQITGIPIMSGIREKPIIEAVDRAIRQKQVSVSEDEADMVTLQVGDARRTFRMRVTLMHDDDDSLLGTVTVLEDITHLHTLDRLKTEFISVASHELRTPVTSLLLSVQLLQEGAVGELTPEQKEIVAAQHDDLVRLERMMRDLLDITRLESGVMTPRLELLPPRELIETAIQTVASQAKAKGVRLNSEISANLSDIQADRTQMTRVLVNLMNNAIRHTPIEGQVSIVLMQKNNNTFFIVNDTGTGIPEDYLPHIFERFVQVPGATRGGAGLGLSIAQTIVEAHGGTISVDSKLGQGSVLTVTLPIAGGQERSQ
ncbi:MAG: HAMP domain-containing protein [Armatimonadetes bacterium]|nr:HAMP domain-containing protein [Armatimonadota bacterium]